MAAINLASPVQVSRGPGLPQFTVSAVNIRRLIDNPDRKVVFAQMEEVPFRIPLWVDDAYDAIGDWTQEQAEDKLLEIIGATRA